MFGKKKRIYDFFSYKIELYFYFCVFMTKSFTYPVKKYKNITFKSAFLYVLVVLLKKQNKKFTKYGMLNRVLSASALKPYYPIKPVISIL